MKHLWHSPLEAGTIHGETDAGIKILGKGGRTKHVFVVEIPTGMKSPLDDPDGLYAATQALATCIERLTRKS
ncbi:MAG: hypothetical protein EXS55_02260 [Candidatus Magasanikbacteria bacterium]|nr:hypothetical protein [Candidatus Magasanikbacteria bacterium]